MYEKNISNKLIENYNLQLINDLKNNIISIQILNIDLKTKQQLIDNLLKQYNINIIWLIDHSILNLKKW